MPTEEPEVVENLPKVTFVDDKEDNGEESPENQQLLIQFIMAKSKNRRQCQDWT